MAFKLLPGTERQFEQLRTLMTFPFVALVAGPPGVGKRTLLDHVAEQAGLRTADFDIEHSKMTAAELRALIARRLTSAQITEDAALRGNTVWVVHNAELLDAHAAVWQSDITRGLRIILKVNDAPPKLREVFKRPIHFNRVTGTRVAAWVREHFPSADAARVAAVAGGDLRQAAIVAAMPSDGKKDSTGHVYFDTLALVNGGVRLEPRQVSTDWVHTNMLGRCTSIEEAAHLSEAFATVDATRCWDAAQATPDLEADIIQGAVHQVRASGKVRYVQGLSKPKGQPQTAATTGQAAGAVRRNRGMLEVLETQHKRRRILQHSERDEQRAVGTQASCMQEAGAECQRPAAELRAAPDAPPDDASGEAAEREGAGRPQDSGRDGRHMCPQSECSTWAPGSSSGASSPSGAANTPTGSGSAGGSDDPGRPSNGSSPVEGCALTSPLSLDSFKYEDNAIMASDARRASFYLANPYTRTAAGGLGIDEFTSAFHLELKKDLPDRFRKFTLLIFEPPRAYSCQEFWVRFAQATGLQPVRHDDAISVCTWSARPSLIAVAYRREDQRPVRLPEGFRGRYVPSPVKKGGSRFTEVEILAHVCRLGDKQVSNLVLAQPLQMPTPIEVVTAAKSLSPGDLSLQRIAASMKLAKDRDPYERAITTGWGATKDALAQLEKPKTQAIHASKVKETGAVQPESVFKPSWRTLRVTIHDRSLLTPLMPRIGEATSTVVSLATYLDHPELHQNVTLFVPGQPRKGKSELAKLICLMLAFRYQESDPYFLLATTLDSLRASQSLMQPGVPVLLDDMGGDDNDVQLIYSSISMWKAILQVKDAVQNRGRNDDIMWAARQPKVVTTNSADLTDWVRTMFPSAKPNHTEAIPPRVAECETIQESLYRGSSALSGAQHFMPQQLTCAEAASAVQDLFG